MSEQSAGGQPVDEAASIIPWIATVILVAIVIVMVAAARSGLERAPYAFRAIGGGVIVMALALISNGSGPMLQTGRGELLVVLVALVVAGIVIACPRWPARRPIDVGASRWFALLVLFPPAGAIIAVMLLAWPPGKRRLGGNPAGTSY